jgi:alginate O-acetyltransferase complex protein AlgI
MSVSTIAIVVGVFLISFATRFAPWVRLREATLLLASYTLYAHLAGATFLSFLIVSSLGNYFIGTFLRRRPSVALLWCGIAFNVIFLSAFKYLPLVVDVTAAFPPEPDIVRRIVLPLGMSFWTFQALSYLIDVYLEVEEDLNPSIIEFCLYMAFWPTVTSGPVCRLPKMLPQFRILSRSLRNDLVIGTTRIAQGLFMKFVLAELMARGIPDGTGITAAFASEASRTGPDVWALAIGYGFQLFFDFAGYSNIVIGAARIIGIVLEENFNRPYLARTPAVFWTRWHMSLSFWIRDYVHLPLTTLSRRQSWRYAALVISMLIFGIWHDAKFTLVMWGLYHGCLLVLYRVAQEAWRRWPLSLPKPLGHVFSWAATFMLMCLGYVFFRATSVSQALQMLGAVVSPATYSHVTLPGESYVMVAAAFCGYFVYVGAGDMLTRWTHYCTDRLSQYRRDAIGPGSLTPSHVAVLRVTEGIAVRHAWIVAPALIILLALTAVSVLSSGSGAAPFIYTAF